MVWAAQEAAVPFPQLSELIEGLGSPTASAATRAAPGPGQEGGKAGEQMLEGARVSRREAVSVGAGTRGSHLCAQEALSRDPSSCLVNPNLAGARLGWEERIEGAHGLAGLAAGTGGRAQRGAAAFPATRAAKPPRRRRHLDQVLPPAEEDEGSRRAAMVSPC